ncbi:NAD(P)/FAD-dependent oxidoreductase [Alkalihalobacillus sp. TS-13]|uniref:NAD(P)/FAD-dependent oxidoreductase n=1 Tax=Alkalihalobacillus sp. TS-13 TaxID=2842455 RepID=UPI001C86C742|nr:FAD-dependent oxidoreductase [Alkalihalobacillus sp. TS-13]
MSKKLLLIGGGRAHLTLLKKLKNETSMDCEITLLNPTSTTYHSDMFSGFVEGIYRLEDLEIDLADLTEKAGIRFVQGTALSIDVKQKMVLTEKGDILSFDVLSLAIGTRLKGMEMLPERDNIFLGTNQIVRFQKSDYKKGIVVIVGGGRDSIEMSLAIQAWKQLYQDDGKVILALLPGEIEDVLTQDKMISIMQNAGIQIQKQKVIEVDDSALITEHDTVSFGSLLWMTESQAPKIYKSSKLPTDQEGYLVVEDTLQVKKFPFIFGAGNSVTIRNQPSLSQYGVIADRQGEVLFENLKGYLETGEGYHFHPTKPHLTMISLGHQTALLKYGPFSTTGKLAWKLKDKMDRTYISSFR